MIHVDVVRLPKDLAEEHLRDRAVVIFDVLRATSTMATALAAGAREIHVFDSLDAVQSAAAGFTSPKVLCGEHACLAPPGFDLGNSPCDFTESRVAGKSMFMCTTNGTRAIVAARGAARRFAASLLNRTATAKALDAIGLDVTLLCAGTNGEVAMEDLIGAGAVIDSLGASELTLSATDALRTFLDAHRDLPGILRNTAGGRNIINAGLDKDIDFAARLDVFDLVAEISGDPAVVRRMIGA
ncbi:MAG TPA: 2-phosphosulfolactate phosphatase [Tepidisphaeraceae bacterium]|nr:2-phosphosulfolactate phosphatase [Tepidisphaeraceae bacterium]